jgi:hypothetical protein
MSVIAKPVSIATPRLGWPAGVRIRYGAAKARSFVSRRGRRARLPVCVVTLLGRHDALVTRVTLYGAILHGGRRLKRREIIALRLPSGWRVKARVQWRFGSQCGVAFLTPVADFARMLCEGAAVKPRGKRRRASTSGTRFPVPTHEELAQSVRAGLTDPLASLTAWAKARAERIRSWCATARGRRDLRSE